MWSNDNIKAKLHIDNITNRTIVTKNVLFERLKKRQIAVFVGVTYFTVDNPLMILLVGKMSLVIILNLCT